MPQLVRLSLSDNNIMYNMERENLIVIDGIDSFRTYLCGIFQSLYIFEMHLRAPPPIIVILVII